MKVLGSVFVILYAGLMLFAIYKNKSKSISSAFIAMGCALSLTYTLLNMAWGKNYIALLMIGMISISAGALINGMKQSNVHIHHHIIRLVVETAITAICWIGG